MSPLRRSRPLAARHASHDLVSLIQETNRGHRFGNPAAFGAQQAREVLEVLTNGEIAVHARGLGDVRHPPPQTRRARGLAENGHCAARDLHAHDGPHQRGLPRTVRPDEARDGASRHRKRDTRQHELPAADHLE